MQHNIEQEFESETVREIKKKQDEIEEQWGELVKCKDRWFTQEKEIAKLKAEVERLKEKVDQPEGRSVNIHGCNTGNEGYDEHSVSQGQIPIHDKDDQKALQRKLTKLKTVTTQMVVDQWDEE